mmetsp:Transcript_45137/g.81513  ORF Transcript_45137/g.81513 Transcript_45137/m.81513 type:complete len:364 (+) Transcript_45137:63-1154(+)
MAPAPTGTDQNDTLHAIMAGESPPAAGGSREVREVWSWNMDEEFDALVAAVAGETGVVLALDMEFPGFVCAEPRVGARSLRYKALRENVDKLRPIQLGAAVATADGTLRGVWSFNLHFNVDVDLHTKSSVAFLRAAGIDFPRHAEEGIDPGPLGRRFIDSCLVGEHGRSPWWVTFSGAYDLGYLLKVLTEGAPLPREPTSFDTALASFCPRRHELRDQLPHGSLDSLARKHGIKRHGAAHTAGSDALLTLELFLNVVGGMGKAAEKKGSPWLNPENWGYSDGWYQGWDNQWAPMKWEDYWACSFAFPPPGPWPAAPLAQNVSVTQLGTTTMPNWPQYQGVGMKSPWAEPSATVLADGAQVLAI